MRTFAQTAAISLGIATICTFWVVSPLIAPSHDTIFHWNSSPGAIFIPTIINVCALWLVLSLLLRFASGSQRANTALFIAIAAALPWIVYKNAAFMYDAIGPRWLSILLFALPIIAAAFLLYRRRNTLQTSFLRTQNCLHVLFYCAACSGLLILCQLLWFSWQARNLNQSLPLHRPQPTTLLANTKPRIIWIVLDELSYQQVYETRFPGLKLTAFDQLAAQSTIFTHTVPAGIMTEIVLPSLLTGSPVDRVRSSSSGQLSTHNPNSNAWTQFDQHQTVFQDALDAGYSTGIVGWYNPYCRILPQVLDSCFWTLTSAAENGMISSLSAIGNLPRPLFRSIGSTAFHHFADQWSYFKNLDVEDAQRHISDYKALYQAAGSILANQHASFVLLHLPVPHPDGIYDRATKSFSSRRTSYIDNLALADRCLAHIRTVLEQQQQWDSSTIVVMGDHSWRTQYLWLNSTGWTPEDQLASHGGQFDDRPVYIVKLPHQHQGNRIDTPFPAVKTRSLLNALMNHQITSPESLSAWTR